MDNRTDKTILYFGKTKFFSLENDVTICRKFKNGLQNVIMIFEFGPFYVPELLVLKKMGTCEWIL